MMEHGAGPVASSRGRNHATAIRGQGKGERLYRRKDASRHAPGGWYEAALQRVLYPLYETGLRRRRTLHHLREYERNQWLAREELDALQWRKLQALVAHCWEQVPFYRAHWSQAGMAAPEDIRNRDDYARLPLLRRSLIHHHRRDMLARSHRDRVAFKTTGGSTGEPLRIGFDRESYERRIAIMFRGYAWTGARIGQRTLYLWSAPVVPAYRYEELKDRLYHTALRRRMLNAFDMSAARMRQYADAIDGYRPQTIVGFVSALVELADWIRRSGRLSHSPERVLCGAEALYPHQREKLEQVFGAPVYDTYGCREFMLIGAECEHRDGLHINSDHLHVEFLPIGASGESNELVVTDLHNYGMPLMRYVNGDLATPKEGACGCGRSLPLMGQVDGRKLDALRTADGRIIPGQYFPNRLRDFRGIRHFQIRQERLHALTVKLVVDDTFEDSVKDGIRAEFDKLFGEELDVTFEIVDDIPLASSGKRRVTICDLPD